ncbi:acyl-CoA synthetase, partial [Streptomyces sp. NPDC059538]
MRTTTAPDTVAELIARQWGDHRPGLKHEDGLLSHHRTAQEAAARAALLVDLMPPGAEPHLGILLDNTPEFPFWLGAAALAGAAVAGINPTRRGPDLARDLRQTDSRIQVTNPAPR